MKRLSLLYIRPLFYLLGLPGHNIEGDVFLEHYQGLFKVGLTPMSLVMILLFRRVPTVWEETTLSWH